MLCVDLAVTLVVGALLYVGGASPLTIAVCQLFTLVLTVALQVESVHLRSEEYRESKQAWSRLEVEIAKRFEEDTK